MAGVSSTMESATESSHSISRVHIAFLAVASGSSLQSSPNTVAGRQESVKENHHHQESGQCGWRSSTAAAASRGRERTGEVGDGVGDGERGADALAAA